MSLVCQFMKSGRRMWEPEENAYVWFAWTSEKFKIIAAIIMLKPLDNIICTIVGV
jgi:hypothetical protein